MKKSVTVEIDLRTAMEVRESLFQDTRIYTYEEKCCPQRVADNRNFIVDLDAKIEEALIDPEEVEQLKATAELEKTAPDYGVGK